MKSVLIPHESWGFVYSEPTTFFLEYLIHWILKVTPKNYKFLSFKDWALFSTKPMIDAW